VTASFSTITTVPAGMTIKAIVIAQSLPPDNYSGSWT